jgi:Holliday junction resolvasome RuvABC DNA-binding subunit
MLIDGLKNLGYNQKQIEIAFKNVKNLEEYNCFDDKIGCLIENIEINSKK